MAGRPKNPDYTVLTWAPDANYPAGASAWSATPTKVAHPGAASVGFTPRAGVPAQCVNYLLSGAYTADAGAKTLLDEVVTYTGQVAPLNWHAPIVYAGADEARGCAYDPFLRRWILAGTSEDVRVSYDHGMTWSVSSLVATAGAGEHCKYVAVDAAGRSVIGTSSAFVFTLSAADVAAKVSVFGGNTEYMRVAYAPTANLFVAATWDALSTFLKTSADQGATWTDRSGTLPAQWGDWTTYAGLRRLLFVSNGSTRLVCVGQGYANGIGPTGVGTCRAMTSDDGGVTWTDRGTFATTISSPDDLQDLSWNETTAEYMYTIGETVGTDSGEVWTSPDGITWTKQVTFTSSLITLIAPNGNQWIGVAGMGAQTDIVYSNDDGATWNKAGAAGPELGGSYALVSGGGGLLLVEGEQTTASLRTGQPALGTVA